MDATRRTPTLRDIQRWMATRILRPAVRAGDLDEWIERPPRGTLDERLAAHIEGYPARLREALAEVFPAVVHVLGGGPFTELVERYITAVRPQSYNLNDAGSDLSCYLDSDGLTERLPFLPDLAKLEWSAACAFHAREQPPLDPTALAGRTMAQWEHCVVRFQPSVAVVRSAWPILDLLRVVDTPREEIDLQLEGRSETVLVFRRDFAVRCESIDPSCAETLTRLMSGSSLGDVMRPLDDTDVTASHVQEWFATWMQAGMIVDCTLRT